VSEIASSPSERGRLRVPSGLRRHPSLMIVYGLILGVYASLSSPNFLTDRNIFNVLRTAAFLGTVAIGETFVIISGGIDLSVGSVIKLSALISAILMNGKPENIGVAGVATLPMAAVSAWSTAHWIILRGPFPSAKGASGEVRAVPRKARQLPASVRLPSFLLVERDRADDDQPLNQLLIPRADLVGGLLVSQALTIFTTPPTRARVR
jgi:hypothetical protein